MNRKTAAIIAACSAIVFVASTAYAISGAAQNSRLFSIISTLATIPVLLWLWSNFRATQLRTAEITMNELSSCTGRIVEQLEEKKRRQKESERAQKPVSEKQAAPPKKIPVPTPVPARAPVAYKRKAS